MGRTARNTDRAGTLTAGPGPVVVGILNVTPDSFSDGGDFLDPEAAAEHAASMLDEGAGMLGRRWRVDPPRFGPCLAGGGDKSASSL